MPDLQEPPVPRRTPASRLQAQLDRPMKSNALLPFSAVLATVLLVSTTMNGQTQVYQEDFSPVPASVTDFNVQLGGDPALKPGNTKIVSIGEWGINANTSFPDIGGANGNTVQPQLDTKANARVAGVFIDPAVFASTGAGTYTLTFDVIGGSSGGAGRYYIGAGSGYDLSGGTDAKLTLALAAPGLSIIKTTGDPAWPALTASGGAVATHLTTTSQEWILPDGTPTGEFRDVPGIEFDVQVSSTISLEFSYDGYSTIVIAFAGYDTDFKIDNIFITSPATGIVWSGLPGSLPREGLVLHLDAITITGKADGDPLTGGWEDQSGQGNDVLPGIAPTYLADSGGGYPAVRFNGTDQYLQGSLATGPAASVFIVYANQRPAPLASYRDALLSTSVPAARIHLSSSRLDATAPDYPAFNALEGAGISVGTWVNGLDTDAVTGDHFQGRYTIGSAVYSAVPTGSTITIGSGNGGEAGQNDIREIILYDRALSASERQAVQDYLGGKYDIQVLARDLEHPIERYNMVLGAQQFGGGDQAYSFGESGIRNLDYARSTIRQGARMIKFRLSNRYDGVDGFSSVPGINSLVELVRDHPEVKEVLDLPVTDLLFWVSTFSVPKWQNRIDANGLEPSAQQDVYDEIYDLAVYLLQNYSGSGKNFYLGNWEGDWMLTSTGSIEPEDLPAERIQAMIDWANVRQQAIDDAKTATPHSDVNVWFYVEMNKADWAREGRPCVLNSVIPAMPKLDFISISAYSMHKFNGDPAPSWRVHSDLDLIQAQLDAKPDPSIPGSRVIVGEYGYIYNTGYTDLEDYTQDHITTVRDILSWQGGTVRFILLWQFFNSATTDTGDPKEMRQINPQNERLPLYYMHENFYRSMRRWVEYRYTLYGTLPTEREFADQADHVLANLSLSGYQPLLGFASYDSWRAFHFPDVADQGNAAVSGASVDPLESGIPNLFRYAFDMDLYSSSRDSFPHLRMPGGGDPVYAIPYNPAKADLIWTGQASQDLSSWPFEVFNSQSTPLVPQDGWVQVSASGQVNPALPVFYRLSLQLAP